MSDYDFRPGGSLKLKSGVEEGGVKKKKKKSGKSKLKEALEKKHDTELQAKEATPERASSSASGRNSPAIVNGGPQKTEAEKRFEEVQRRRLAERVAKLANQTHKDRVHDFNSKLEALSEHHDIPKVGPG
ncbi:DUF1754-domain-containing protein [Rickenella mellea]|uniref:DUF1754-domain-containing protein n=1 Tax=Rickenella mellea TaxID=50990 RepID=A0A4Y7QM65_9AGAM|nr:DUF1754-domain-containing protein [Rickenella mellea]